MTNATASSETTANSQGLERTLRTVAITLALTLTLVSVGCSRGGGSRFNGGNNTTVNTPPPVSTPPAIANFNVDGGVDPVTLQVQTPTGPFSTPVRFSYLLDDVEDSELQLFIEYSRASAPTTFLPATLIGASNPITGLLAADYEDPQSSANNFVWDAQTDLNPGPNGLVETAQFRITVSEASVTGPTQAVGGGVSFNFPLPANVLPQSVSFAPAASTALSANVELNYEVTDADSDDLTISMFYTGPIVAGQPVPAAQPMTLIQVNSNPATPVAGQAVNTTLPNSFTVTSANYSGSVIWDSLNDVGVSQFEDYIFTMQVSDGVGAAPALQTPTFSVGNPTAAFAQSLSVIGRSGDIPISIELFDSDSDNVAVSLEVTFNGVDFVPLTLATANVGTISANTVTGVPASPTGSAFTVVWRSAVDLPVGITSGVLRATVVDDDRATEVPNALPTNLGNNPNNPPLPNLFIHGGQGGFPAGTLFLLSSSVSLAGPPVVVKVQADLSDPFYAPTLSQRFQIEGENFGTDESLVTVLINNVSQSVVEADSNFLLVNPVFGTKTGLLQVIVNGLPSNTVPVLVPGNDYWTDTTLASDEDPIQLPQINDPSVHGEFHDLDGDGDLDIIVAQDGTNSILINNNLNRNLTSLLAGPFTITAQTNRLELNVVRSAISREAGPYNAAVTDEVTVVTSKISAGPNTPIASAIATTTPLITAGQIVAGRTHSLSSTGYVAALLNSASNNVGIGRTFSASVLNRKYLEVFPTVVSDQLAVFESSAAPFANRQTLGFNNSFQNGYGTTGTDRITVSTTGNFNVGDVISNGLAQAVVFRITPGAAAGQFLLDVSVQPGFVVGQNVVSQVGVSGSLLSITRNPGASLGGTKLTVNLPTGTLAPVTLVGLLNDAAINAGLDVPGLIINLVVNNGSSLVQNTTVTTQAGFSGVVLRNTDNRLIRLRVANTAVATGDTLIVNGAQVATVTAVIPTRNDFEARLASNGLNVQLFSNDVLVIGNAAANQALGFISTRLITTQSADNAGNYRFDPEFTDLTISLGDQSTNGSQEVVIPLSGTLSVVNVVDAINAQGVQALLSGNANAGRFEASVVTSSSGERFIEVTTDDPSLSINVLDQGAQRVLGLVGRFIKPHARGLGTFLDETPARLPNQTSEFTTKIEVFDADQDGDPDFLEVNSLAQNRLYINGGLGNFTDQTTNLLPAFQDESFGAVSADLDNDGDNDIVIANRGRNRILENRTGEMNPQTNQLFTAGTMTDRSFFAFDTTLDSATTKISSDVQAGDLDGDGLLDLVFANLTRTAGAGPFILFNQNASFPTQSSDPDKFLFSSPNFVSPTGGAVNADSFIRESSILFQAVAGNSQNFTVSLGDVNADRLLDIVIGNEANGLVTTNFAFEQRSNVIVLVLDQINGVTLSLKKDDVLTNVNAPNSSATVVEVLANFPNANEVSVVLDQVPADFTAGAQLTSITNPVARTIISIRPPTTLAGNRVEYVAGGTIQDVFEEGGWVDYVGAGGNVVFGPSQMILPGLPANANTLFVDLFELPPTSSAQIRQVSVTSTIQRTNLNIFASRTQLPAFDFLRETGLLGVRRSVYDYPKGFNNGNLDKRGSDSSKDVVLGDENGRLRERTPTIPSNLIHGLNDLGGGGNAFARFTVFANSEDRTTVPFEFGNILFVTNDENGNKISFFSDTTNRPFLTTPFIIHTTNDQKHHMVIDTTESFGVDMADLDNDGDLDVLFLNGGGQGAGAQNFIYSANIEPGDVNQLQGAYP